MSILRASRSIIDATLAEGKVVEEFMDSANITILELDEVIHAQSTTLREPHVFIKPKPRVRQSCPGDEQTPGIPLGP
jgi:hypothetical protein